MKRSVIKFLSIIIFCSIIGSNDHTIVPIIFSVFLESLYLFLEFDIEYLPAFLALSGLLIITFSKEYIYLTLLAYLFTYMYLVILLLNSYEELPKNNIYLFISTLLYVVISLYDIVKLIKLKFKNNNLKIN